MSWVAAGVSAGLNLGMAAYQAHTASKLAKTPRPEYQIPQAQIGALNNAKYMASQTELPGQNIMQQKIDQGSAGALANLKDVSQSGSALGSNIASIYRGNVGAQNELNLAAAQNFNNNQGNFRAELNNMAPFEQKKWETNEFDPYKNNMAAASAMREGAFRNATAGVTDLAAAGAGAANRNYWDKQLNPEDNTETTDFNFDMTGGVKNKQPLTSMTSPQNYNNQAANNYFQNSNNNPGQWFKNYSLNHR